MLELIQENKQYDCTLAEIQPGELCLINESVYMRLGDLEELDIIPVVKLFNGKIETYVPSLPIICVSGKLTYRVHCHSPRKAPASQEFYQPPTPSPFYSILFRDKE